MTTSTWGHYYDTPATVDTCPRCAAVVPASTLAPHELSVSQTPVCAGCRQRFENSVRDYTNTFGAANE